MPFIFSALHIIGMHIMEGEKWNCTLQTASGYVHSIQLLLIYISEGFLRGQGMIHQCRDIYYRKRWDRSHKLYSLRAVVCVLLGWANNELINASNLMVCPNNFADYTQFLLVNCCDWLAGWWGGNLARLLGKCEVGLGLFELGEINFWWHHLRKRYRFLWMSWWKYDVW